jgi:hypothetical protein
MHTHNAISFTQVVCSIRFPLSSHYSTVSIIQIRQLQVIGLKSLKVKIASLVSHGAPRVPLLLPQCHSRPAMFLTGVRLFRELPLRPVRWIKRRQSVWLRVLLRLRLRLICKALYRKVRQKQALSVSLTSHQRLSPAVRGHHAMCPQENLKMPNFSSTHNLW